MPLKRESLASLEISDWFFYLMLLKNIYEVSSNAPAVYCKAFRLKLVPISVPKTGCLDQWVLPPKLHEFL